MRLSFCSLASGSSGNCYFVRTENTALLVDAGISGRRIFNGLAALGADPEQINGIFVTHEHIDHIRGIPVFIKRRAGTTVFASEGTWKTLSQKIPEERHRAISAGEILEVGDIEVTAFALSHDAGEPVGYSFAAGGKRVSIVTDTGCITEEIHAAIRDSDILVIEANHDVQMLEFGRYPYDVKRRILGEYGHLSNEAAAMEICRVSEETKKYREVLLAHLSKENNFPEMAYQTVRNLLEERGLCIGRELGLHIIARDEASPLFTLEERIPEK